MQHEGINRLAPRHAGTHGGSQSSVTTHARIEIPSLCDGDPSHTLVTHSAEAGYVSVQRTPTLSYVVLPEGTRRGSVFAVHETGAPVPPKPRLLDRVRAALRIRHYSRRTEKAYVAWISRYILFHGKHHPVEMGAPELTRFPSSLAVDRKVEGLHPEPGAERTPVPLPCGTRAGSAVARTRTCSTGGRQECGARRTGGSVHEAPVPCCACRARPTRYAATWRCRTPQPPGPVSACK